MSVKERTFFGHPVGLFTLFFTEMWERFSYYGMKAILMLFMISDAAKEGLGLDTETAGAAYGLYAAGVYLLTLPGGWIADNIIGQRKAIWYGGIVIMLGHLTLAIPSTPAVFFLGLALIAIGTGLLKPNISTIVGDLYPEGGARRDAGFSVFYMGINVGSFLGQLIVPLLAQNFNWHVGFGAAAVGMFLGLVQYRITNKHLFDIGKVPKAKQAVDEGKSSNKIAIAMALGLVALIFILQYAGIVDLSTAIGIRDTLGVVIVLITLFYFAYIFIGGGLNVAEKKRMAVVFLLFIGAAIFWAGFEQAPTTLTLFADQLTNRSVFGLFEIPSGSVQSINPMFIIIFAPIFGALWIKLAARHMNPSAPLKFGFGLILMALGFFVMVQAAKVATPDHKVGLYWFVLTYFLHTAGELTLSPVGLSTMTKLAPKKLYGQVMGLWFVATAMGNLIAGWYGGEFDATQLGTMPDLFMSVVWLGLIAGIFFILISPMAKRWMGNVE